MKRTLLLGSAWTASAAAAVGLGFLAISFVDASASPGTATVAAATSAPDDSGAPSAASSTAPATDSTVPVAAGQQVTEGGTVYGSCTGGDPVLASAPAAGWWLDDSSNAGTIEFRDGTQRIEVRITCVDGSARFSVEGPRADDSHGGGGGTPGPAATTTQPAVDDSAGRGGGHGADG
jgi:hypothetical protein